MLANENSASQGASDGEQIDVVVMAKNWLEKNPESCQVSHDGTGGSKREQGGGSEHKHGSVRCITAFLGTENWSKTKVANILESVGLHDDVKSILHSRKSNESGNKPIPGVIAVGAGPALAILRAV